jgi:carbon-monoxide dehydrogenase large subunit
MNYADASLQSRRDEHLQPARPPASRRRPLACSSARREAQEDARLVTGRGRYVDDLSMPGLLISPWRAGPHAHARIVRVDRARPSRSMDVVTVLTPRGHAGAGRLDPTPRAGAARARLREPGARGRRVPHVASPWPWVVAVNPYVAADAVERVVIEYEALPAR